MGERKRKYSSKLETISVNQAKFRNRNTKEM